MKNSFPLQSSSTVTFLSIALGFLFFTSSFLGKSQTYDGYTFYAAQNGTKAYLVDLTGTTYHTWTFTKSTCYSSYLLSGGVVLRTVNHSGNSFTGGPVSGEVQKVDYNGNILWDYVYSTTSYCSHHDVHAMPNGNVLLIAYELKTAAQVTAAGCSQNIVMWPDKIVEIQPSGTSGGTVVWEWHVWDHLVQHYDATKPSYGLPADHPELLNINYLTTKDWMHVNGIDYNPALDQIVFSSHTLNEVYVIDHSTTTAQAATHSGGNSGKGGDILYRWGNPAAYETAGTTIFNVVHDAHWIPSTNPTYPNSLCAFNNKGGTGTKSCVDIFTPPYTGYNYSITAGSAYTPSTYTWRHTYSGTATQDMGSSQQLPNGNMLVCIAQSGLIYEINASQVQVWSKSAGGIVPQAFRYPPCFVTGSYVAAATATPTTLCAGNSTQLNVTAVSGAVYTYSWSSSPAGFTSTLQNPTVSPTITTVYTATITNGPCSASNNVTVIVNPKPAAVAGANRSICTGLGTQIGAAAVAGSTYSWTSVPSGFTSTAANPIVSPAQTTTYTIIETVTATGCNASHSVTVTVNPLPGANAGSKRNICEGSSTQIGSAAVSGNIYSWTSLPAGFSSNQANPFVSPVVSTEYFLVETISSTGCSKSGSVPVNVDPLPLPAGNITGPASVQQGQSGITYSITAIDYATEYHWSLPSGAIITGGDNTNTIVVSYSDTASSGTISVHGTNACGNGIASPDLEIVVESLVPVNLILADSTIASGQSSCFNAKTMITVGGIGGPFQVEAGGSATLIAGQSISFIPSAAVYQSGYLRAYISLTNEYCTTSSAPLPAVGHNLGAESQGGPEEIFFKAYPNPTSGKITLEISDGRECATTLVQVMSMHGDIVYRGVFQRLVRKEISLGNSAPGLYFIRAVRGSQTYNIKIVKE
ncbi:MAG: aryl-sulfate sulfotransferase [Bacteroidetes bacterium]|nr:aryl-sulfate sulfotransferase [Bacteroidota bacterium]